MSELLELDELVAAVHAAPLRSIGQLEEALANPASPDRLHLLAPCDLQPVKAAGVTFATSMLERVIEEKAAGDPAQAESVRREVLAAIGDDLARVKPGSAQALALKQLLIDRGMWSQYLEVAIGPDAEIFSKSAPMSALGTGVPIGLHPASTWNNPEPELVLAVDSRARVRGVTLGNDVNLRDFEGRSALLLGKSKDNNGSCAIGPFIRLFDEHYSIDDARQAVVTLRVEGEDGFLLEASSSMAKISRDPLQLVGQAMGETHQYPDGMMLFCGTMFAPVQDRDAPGAGFTHKPGDLVTIAEERLGALINSVSRSDRIAPWTFGLRALIESLAARGLPGGKGAR
jgi:fumarylacetoacetate (FAA) hydrolase family protein